MNDTVKYQIERIGFHGQLTGMAYNYRQDNWVPVSREEVAFPTKQGAKAVCEEVDLEINLEVMITEHIWPAPA